MVSLENNVLNVRGQIHKIKCFEVAWQTPKGITNNIDVAVDVCRSLSFDPDLTIRPVVIAVSEDNENIYEIVH